jgi:hypothetical protein
MGTVYKIDGFGTRESDSASGQLANLEQREKFVSMVVYAHVTGGSVTISKGQLASLEMDSAKNITYQGATTGLLATFGAGNCVTGTPTSGIAHASCIGAFAESVTLADGEYKIISVQVYGKGFALHHDAGAKGEKLYPSGSSAGKLTDDAAADADADSECVALQIDAATDPGTGFEGDVFFLNPLNL